MNNKPLFPALIKPEKQELESSNLTDQTIKPILHDTNVNNFFKNVELSDDIITILNKLNFDEICLLKDAFNARLYRNNRGSKKKKLPISYEEVEKRHDSGVTYQDMAKEFGMSYKTLRLILNEYEKNPNKEL